MANGRRAEMNGLVRFLATGGYLGYAPVAPGTVGSLGCALILWFLAPSVADGDPGSHIAAALVTFAAFVALAFWVADRAERHLGHDSSRIVIDEYAGFVLAVLLLPKSLFVYGVAFALFRALDILKPFPARRAEGLPGGIGVVMDDLVAGLYTNLLIRVMLLVKGW